MNSKKKNKHRANKPNPASEQKVESENVSNQEEKIEEKVVAVVEERVPEIVCEVSTPSVETKEIENEPKKPKRNKGKKKNLGKANEEEEQEKSKEITDDKTQEVSLTDKKDVESTETKITDDTDIAPAARKNKKNKNKKKNEQADQTLEENVLTNVIQDVKKETVEVTSIIPDVEKTEPESKSAKKKNKKKKNRNDSEKSDKAEEALACTAAFQKLIVSSDKQDDNQKQTKLEEENITKVVVSIPKAQDKDKSLKPMTGGEIPQEKDAESWDEMSSKNKKKNKKDKKHPSKTGDHDVATVPSEEPITSAPPEEKCSKKESFHKEDNVAKVADTTVTDKNINKDFKTKMIETTAVTIKDEKKKPEPEKTIIEAVETVMFSEETKEPSSKEKATIAKPVDKKRKGKHQHDWTEDSKEITTEPEAEIASQPISLADDKIQAEPCQNLPKEEIKPMESICQPTVKETNIEAGLIIDDRISKPQVPLESLPSDDSDDFVMTPLTEDREEDIPDTKTKKTVTSEELMPKEDIQLIPTPEGQMEKKRKKSPKPHSKLETDKPLIAEIKDKEIPIEEIKRNESITDMPPLEDIEITSVKTNESEGSACDVTPYIHYPRSISQQRLDSNNNTEIQEISKEAALLEIPSDVPDTPFIQDSGETPALTPEMSTSIKITDVKETPYEEKTDLKSKVMEVNQDMEELRLSIERSLAEFTAMEKSEDSLEKAFKKSDISCNVKLDEQSFTSKTVDITSVQKEKVTLPPIKEANKETEAITQCASRESRVTEEKKPFEIDLPVDSDTPPICPARKDNKGKNKSNKKKGKQQSSQTTNESTTTAVESNTSQGFEQQSSTETKESKTEQKSEQKQESKEKGKQQSSGVADSENSKTDNDVPEPTSCEPIENFEDAMTSSLDDVNKSFEMIVNESIETQNNPEINVTGPKEDDNKPKQAKQNPVSQPKNLLGHPDIPVPSNRIDYKKEKNKPPNTRQAKVKIRDDVPVEKNKESKECQTENRNIPKEKLEESVSCMTNENEEYVYKYSFRKVFLPSACQVCKKDLRKLRVPCNFCSLVFYCNTKHKDEDWTQHQALCFAVSTIVHLREQKHIYSNAKNITGHNYRLLRMQMIVACEKVLKRKLVPWEQEALLYPRICADAACREWRQEKLKDCEGCGQIPHCSDHPEHLPKSHQRWCKSYSLYEKLVSYQQTKGRLEPKLPGRVMTGQYVMTEKMNEVLASMYEERIDMNDVEYAALTQLATAPLTAAYCYQLYYNNSKVTSGANRITKSFTIHVVGAELQFEADALNKWEIFFLHLRPDVQELRVVLIAPDLNPSNLPLDLLAKVKHCDNCQSKKRRVLFNFQDNKTYSEYSSSNDFISPDIVCAFNAAIQRSTVYNGKDHWPSTIISILKQKSPFLITSYTMSELKRDLARIKEIAEVKTLSEAKNNAFGSVRPDRNFISDDEMPLLFKNYCFAVCSGF